MTKPLFREIALAIGREKLPRIACFNLNQFPNLKDSKFIKKKDDKEKPKYAIYFPSRGSVRPQDKPEIEGSKTFDLFE